MERRKRAFDIETIPDLSILHRLPEPEVAVGNLVDPVKIAAKVAEAKATGNAAGVTKAEIAEFAEAYERSTLRGNEEITNAATELLTFKGVSQETFFEAIKLANDLSVVMGSDLNSVILRFGKLLEDPVQNMNALSKAGVTFTSQQADMIKSLVETGNESEALAIILQKVREKVGGAAEGEAGGLTGATHRLRVEWDDLLKAFGANIAESGAVQNSLDFLSGRLAAIQKEVRGTLQEQREAEQKKVDNLKNFGTDQLAVRQDGPGIYIWDTIPIVELRL